MNKRTLYFARPANMEGSELERDCIKLLLSKWENDTIVFSGDGAHLTAENVVVLPFPDGNWGTDEWNIANDALKHRRRVWVIDPATRDIRMVSSLPYDKRRLTSGQTLARLYFHDGSLRTQA